MIVQAELYTFEKRGSTGYLATKTYQAAASMSVEWSNGKIWMFGIGSFTIVESVKENCGVSWFYSRKIR